ncbi:HemK methyltransferase family member 1 [Tupaia chinensis]|uniref:HemK methyltransferase family member 1 n=1 Tax=Tupaia chinensis TaxID=246437 RepID=L8Y1Z2_TUPCH|nr:HemK methyltransferase family member 1 [Tupaia chinensis]
MESWGPMLRALLSGPGRRGGTRGWAFRSGQPHLPLAGLSSATELVNHWTGVFEKRGIPEARESSEYIVAHVLGAKTFQSLRPALRTQPLSPQQLQCIQELSSCRLQRMPVQYILGEWDFKGLSLKMAPPVFIPRPETEELVEWVLEEVVQRPRVEGAQDGPLILEVGCGSGAIALSLLSQLPETLALEMKKLLGASLFRWDLEQGPRGGISWHSASQPSFILGQSRVIAVDKGEAAISLTHENAQRLRLQDRIWMVPLDVTLGPKTGPGCGWGTALPGTWWQVALESFTYQWTNVCCVSPSLSTEGSWTHLLPWGPVDLVVSNPPYVFHQDMEQLAPEIRSYEDVAALDGGEEGMDVIAHILALAPQLLKDSGNIFLEVDPRQPELVSRWLQSRPDLDLQLVAVRRDFCGRPRFLHIRRSGP